MTHYLPQMKDCFKETYTKQPTCNYNTTITHKTDFEAVWSDIRDEKIKNNDKAYWIVEEINKSSTTENMQIKDIIYTDVTNITTKLQLEITGYRKNNYSGIKN